MTRYRTRIQNTPIPGAAHCAALLLLTLLAAPSSAAVVTQVIDWTGDGTNLLFGPSGVAIDHHDNVLVSGGVSNNVLEASAAGGVRLIVGPAGDGTAILDMASRVAVDLSGGITVSGAVSNNVFRVTSGGRVAEVLDASGDGNAGLSMPLNVTVDGSGNMYVVGSLSHTVFRISANHQHVTLLMDASGDGTNSLSGPTGIAVDRASNVYVTGRASNNVFRIDPAGAVTQILDASGDGTNPLSAPDSVTVDRFGQVYVAGRNSNNVFRINGTGVRQVIGAAGDGTNALTGPGDVEVDPFGRLYVVGEASDNVFQVDPNGRIVQVVDASGDGTNALTAPSDLARSSGGDLYVAGRASDNVMRVEPDVRLSLNSDTHSLRAGAPLPFALTLENPSATTQSFQLNLALVRPNNSRFVLVPNVSLNLPAGAAPTLNAAIPLPGAAPTGSYKLVATAQRPGEPAVHAAELKMPVLAASHPVFTDVTASAGVNFAQAPMASPLNCLRPFLCLQEYFSGSAAAADYDNDGLTDLYVTRPYETGILYRNVGGGTFSDTTAAAGLDTLPGSNGVAWVDVDNDGDQDLYVASLGGTRNYLLINQGNGQFIEDAVARGAAVETAHMHFGMGIALGDVDGDGWIDIYVSEWLSEYDIPAGVGSHARLLRNLGPGSPGHFENVTAAAGLDLDYYPSPIPDAVPAVLLGFAPSLTDLDGDGFPDFTITGDLGTSRLFWNDGDGTFTEGTFAAGVATSASEMGSTMTDYDKDGDLDWFVTAITCAVPYSGESDCTGNRLYRNEGNRLFSDQTDAAGVRVGHWGWGAVFFDYDNDSHVDIVHTNGIALPSFPFAAQVAEDNPTIDPMRLFRNRGDGTFMQVSEAAGLTDTGPGKGLLTFDFDNDGDLDVFVMNTGGPPRLYRNDGGNAKGWLRVDVEGTQSNRDGTGARITVTPVTGGPSMLREVSDQSYFLGQSERTAHFGLGNGVAPVAEVRVYWPVSGVEQIFQNVARNSTLVVTEPSS